MSAEELARGMQAWSGSPPDMSGSAPPPHPNRGPIRSRGTFAMSAICPNPRLRATRFRSLGLTAAGTMALLLAGMSAAVARAPDIVDHSVAGDEAAVAKAPREAALRAALGHAYLRDGRFESAATALGDAQALGDSSSRTALGLALADIAIGHSRDAVALLDGAHDQLPVTDLGLALALAGETGRGVAILADAMRAGGATQTLRQNLAYAYALDGRWNEARTLAMLDLPADKVDARLTQWSATARPEAYRARVAALLGAPVRDDGGMPATLALNASAAPTLAAAAMSPAPGGELPATAPAPVTVASADPIPASVAPAPEPVVASAELAPSAPAPVVASAAPAPYVPAPVVASAEPAPIAPSPAELAAVHTPAHAGRHAHHAELAEATPVVPMAPVAQGDHMIQIGAFLSQANAERIRHTFAAHNRYPGHAIAVTQANVGGRTFWRVTVAGFASASASTACDSVKAHGGGCFAYAGTGAANGEALAMAGTPHEIGGSRAHRR